MKVSARVTKYAFRVHGWLGFAVGLFFLIMGLSGSLLLFRDELDPWLNRTAHHVAAGDRRLPVDELYRNVVARYPHLTSISILHFPTAPGDCYEFLLFRNVGDNYHGVLYSAIVNPYTSAIVREGDYGSISYSFLRWLYQFHYCFQAGTLGMLLTGIIGLLMLFSLLTGIIVYRRHFTDAFRLKTIRRIGRRRSSYSALHRVIGVWSLLLNAILFFTGFWLNLPAFKKEGWSLTPQGSNQVVTVSIDSVLSSICGKDGFRPISIDISTTGDPTITINGRFPHTFFLIHDYASHFVFDGRTGELDETYDIRGQSPAAKLGGMAYNAHTGKWGSAWIKLIYVIIGLTPGLLTITGATLWWRRTYGRRLVV